MKRTELKAGTFLAIKKKKKNQKLKKQKKVNRKSEKVIPHFLRSSLKRKIRESRSCHLSILVLLLLLFGFQIWSTFFLASIFTSCLELSQLFQLFVILTMCFITKIYDVLICVNFKDNTLSHDTFIN